MADTDWIRIAFEGAIGMVSGVSGMVLGAYREGRRSVQREHKIKEDYDGKIGALRRETENQFSAQNAMIISVERESIDRIDSLRHETGEMGSAIRQRIHEVEIDFRDRLDQMGNSIRESIEKMGDRLEDKIERAVARREGREK